MKKITVFDFDGTLTSTDSMMAVIIYQRGKWGMAWALLRQIHLIVLMMLKAYSNQKTKEHLLNYCFGQMTEEELDDLFTRFAASHQHIIRPEMAKRLEEAHQEERNTPIVITASPRMWVEKFVEGTTVLGTELEFKDGRFTGRFTTKNCYGAEKVSRLKEHIKDLSIHRDEYYITAYGDSRGDKEMLEYANEGTLLQ